MEDVEKCEEKLRAKGLAPKIMIDLSHENSGKDHKKQQMVLNDVITQKKAGNKSIFGIMIESNLHEGNQKITDNIDDLEYGVSITDSCISWEETEKMLNDLHGAL